MKTLRRVCLRSNKPNVLASTFITLITIGQLSSAVGCKGASDPSRSETTVVPIVSSPPSADSTADRSPTVGPAEVERGQIAAIVGSGSVEQSSSSGFHWDPNRIVDLRVSASDDGRLEICGRARDGSDVAGFAYRIHHSVVFEHVLLLPTQHIPKGDYITFCLTVKCIGKHYCAAQDVQRIWSDEMEKSVP